MLKLLIFRCTRCSETGAHSDHFLLHINNADVDRALATFARFRRCAEAYLRAHRQGADLARLAVPSIG